MVKLFLSFFATVVVFIIFSASSCGNKNVKDTTFIASVPTPEIKHMENNGSNLTLTIDQHYNKSTHQDLQEIIILADTISGEFQSYSNTNLTSLDNVSDIPLYKGASKKLVLSGTTFSVSVDIGTSGLTVGNPYNLAAVTRGSNEFYAKAFEHNGWFFSKRSDDIYVYVSSSNSVVLTNLYSPPTGGVTPRFGFTVEGTPPIIKYDCTTPANSISCDLELSVENKGGFKVHLTVPCGVNPNEPRGLYNYLLLENQKSLYSPNENDAEYLCGVPFPVSTSRGFMGRTANFYFRIHIDKIDGPLVDGTSKGQTTISVFIQPVGSRLFF